ncbi:MAG: hypothetical protein EA396_01215 [Anaerolineaceae bacterium]|nr:MAG: hypothetical protein EA396_01215 [Anaerolineaceae bacterium]
MNRKGKLAGVDPFGADQPDEQPDQGDDAATSADTPKLSMSDADAALFGELSRREGQRQNVRGVSIFSIYPDAKQPRRAVPSDVRAHWSGEPKDIADLFNAWLQHINAERKRAGRPRFRLDDVLWAESVQAQNHDEEDMKREEVAGPVERGFLQVIDLAISIRRDGLANPVTLHRAGGNQYRLETGERRWLAYHVLYGYFNGADGKPQERDKWENIPSLIVEHFSVWRQASENTARADLNAIGRARQFALLLMDLLQRSGETFRPFEAMTRGGSDRAYYAQVLGYRVPSGKSELLSNGIGVTHRAAFSRCRTLLGLPDEVWTIGDNISLSEDELLRLARIEPASAAIKEARELAQIVASRNNFDSPKPTKKRGSKSPTLFDDSALKTGKRLFSKQNALIAKEILEIRDGVTAANPATKQQLKQAIDELRGCLNQLESKLGDG